ncbi:unnamed protein product [Zymoseptoria tritici ST99CH_3D7]|uniref:Uncharacterized protein n=1 Tax=Zymoseptoria tritici (strain ST99CH_3D7) TaxID=1276538 RepID=A0A1X7S5S9_ZYMT9|nr:unnamed protein product [Zymoseptoria tritici ST99CH_3D7]
MQDTPTWTLECSGRDSHLFERRIRSDHPRLPEASTVHICFLSAHRSSNLKLRPFEADHISRWPYPQTATTPTTSAAAGMASTYRASNKNSAK